MNLRTFVVRASHLDDLVGLGTLTPHAARFLGAAVASGLNILVAGGTQAGKTTLLNRLSAAIPPRERVVTWEEVFELLTPRPGSYEDAKTLIMSSSAHIEHAFLDIGPVTRAGRAWARSRPAADAPVSDGASGGIVLRPVG